MGVVAFNTAAVLLGTQRSPHANKENGTALFNRATSSSQCSDRHGGSP